MTDLWSLMCAMWLVLVLAPALLAADVESSSPPTATTNAPSKFRSIEDGWLDLSGFIDQSYGFAPIVMPITEPAVGYGAAGGLAFIGKPRGEAPAGFGRPNLTAVGGMGTANGTWGALAADSRHWLDDRLQTLVGVACASINLDYYGIGEDSLLKSHPLRRANRSRPLIVSCPAFTSRIALRCRSRRTKPTPFPSVAL